MFKEIFETNNITTLEIIKSLFRVNQVNFQVLNETTLQTGSLEALGIQGAVVQVHEENYIFAKKLLVENKILIESENNNQSLHSMNWIDKNFNFLFLEGKPAYIKLLFIVGFILLIIGGISYYQIIK